MFIQLFANLDSLWCRLLQAEGDDGVNEVSIQETVPFELPRDVLQDSM